MPSTSSCPLEVFGEPNSPLALQNARCKAQRLSLISPWQNIVLLAACMRPYRKSTDFRYLGTHGQASLESFESAINLLLSSLSCPRSVIPELAPSQDAALQSAISALSSLSHASASSTSALARLAARRACDPSASHRLLSALLAAAAAPSTASPAKGVNAVLTLWDRSRPLQGAAGRVLGTWEVVGCGEAVVEWSRSIEEWGGWKGGGGAEAESVAR